MPVGDGLVGVGRAQQGGLVEGAGDELEPDRQAVPGEAARDGDSGQPGQADRLPADRTVPIAIYCRTGPMSATAAEALRSLGYTDVVELQGGMKAWQASGRPLVGG